MPPQTRSRGQVPVPKVYHSSPAPQQLRFPSRRKMVKTYSKKHPREVLKQTTITQIDFLTPVDPDELEDMEPEDDEPPREPGPKRKRRRKTEGDEPEPEVAVTGSNPNSSFHTQTLTQFCGDILTSGVMPNQKERVIRDSEDESDGLNEFFEVERGGKAARVKWASSSVKNRSSPPRSNNPHTPSNKRKSEVLIVPSSQPSPFTPMLDRYSPAPRGSPLKSRSTNVGTPMPKPRSVDGSALKKSGDRRVRKLVIEDSYASASTVSPGFVPSSAKSQKSIKLDDVGESEERSETTEDSEKENRTPAEEVEHEGGAESQKVHLKVMEIADSEDDGSGFDDSEDEDATVMPASLPTNPKEVSQELGQGLSLLDNMPSATESVLKEQNMSEDQADQGHNDGDSERENNPATDAKDEEDPYPIGAETQFVMGLIASGEDPTHNPSSTNQTSRFSPLPAVQVSAKSTPKLPQKVSTGASLRKTPKGSSKKASVALSSPRVYFEDEERSPALHRTQAYTQMNSQRVDLEVINSMPKPTARSDIFVSIHPEHVEKIVNGTKNHEFRAWKVPNTVVRMWIYVTKPESRVRYMASISPAKEVGEIEDESGLGNAEFNQGKKKASYAYELLELYELNNPVSLARMKEYGWLEGPPQKYAFVPPAVVSQLQANLRCQLLVDHESEDEDVDFGDVVQDSQTGETPQVPQRSQAASEKKTVSQEVAAQLHSDYIHTTQLPADDLVLVPSSQTPPQPKKSSPKDDMLPPLPIARATRSSGTFATPKRPRKAVAPSQATTTSASSTPSPHKSAPQYPGSLASLPVFNDSVSPARVPDGDFGLRSSQLITVSQLLPDSLVRDHAPQPPVIWDSEDDNDEL